LDNNGNESIGGVCSQVSSVNHATLPLLRRLVRDHVARHWPRLVAAFACMGVVAATAAGNAWLMQPMLDKVFVAHDAALLYVIPTAVIALAFAKGFAGYGQAVLMMTVGQRIVADIQNALFARMMRADLAFFHANPTGTLVARFINDAGMLRSAATTILAGLGKEAVTAIGLIALMFYQDWVLALVAVAAFPFIVQPLARLGRRMRRVSTNTQVEVGRLTTILNQVFQGARHVKAYGMEAYEEGRTQTIIERLYHLVQRAQRVRSIPSPLMETLGGIAVAGVILYGGHQVIIGTRTPGTFFSFITALLLAYQPLKVVASLNIGLQEGLAAAARLFAILDVEPEIRDRPNAKPLTLIGGEIRFDRVAFDYPNGTHALDGIDLLIPAGKTVALVGASGAGKSTIFNLIPRFYDVTCGAIVIDGTDIRDATIASLRGAIALVSQEVSLFDDTVRANIGYGRIGAAEEDIVAAAASAAADGFIRALPRGYDTEVGEQGAKLSGGQRQRIAIARAMLKNAPILLLDEATSALDTESERQVQAALRQLMRGRTTLVIAHRLSTVIDADLIYVVDHGRIVERGSHVELLHRGGAYARLYAMQFAEQDRLADLSAARAARA
jgi:ATP-binding cassette, subfamily B, bacterial MsbA